MATMSGATEVRRSHHHAIQCQLNRLEELSNRMDGLIHHIREGDGPVPAEVEKSMPDISLHALLATGAERIQETVDTLYDKISEIEGLIF